MAGLVRKIVGTTVKGSNFIKPCLACDELAQGDTGQIFLPEGSVGNPIPNLWLHNHSLQQYPKKPITQGFLT